MARSFNGSSDYLLATDTPVSSYPLTMCAWVYAANQTHNGSALVISDASALDSSIGIRTNSGTAGAYDYTPASGFLESTGGTVTASTWVHLAGVFASATSRTVYVNGSAGTPNTSNSGRTFGNEDAVTVGRLTRSAPTGYFNGRIAEVAIWTVALTQPELAALASGTSPLLIRPDALVRYYPILGVNPETNYKSGGNLTLTGTTLANHVSIAKPSSPIIFLPTATGGTNIAAGVDSLSLTEQTANINAAKSIAANVDNLTLSELAANINAAINVNANVASLTLTEFAAAIKADTSIAANVDTLTLTTFAASLGAGTEISAGVASLTLSELAASINAAKNIQAAAAGLTLTEYQSAVSFGRTIQANVDALTLTELQAAVNAARNITTNVDVLSLSTYQALVDAGLFDGITIDGQQSVSITQNYGSLVIYSNKRNYYTL